MGRLEGKVALVTGGGRGIGKGIVEVLSREGARVAVADLNFGNAARTATEIEELGRRAIALELDVSKADQAATAVAQAIDVFGQLDILVNNAGVLGEHGARDITLDDWQMVLDVNLKSIWIMSRAVIPHYRERGSGKIVNIASIAGRHGGQLHPHYSASKAGVINLTQSLAMELGPRNINVNAVCPGLVRTDMMTNLEGMVAAMRRQEPGGEGFVPGFIATSCPLRREQTPEDIGMAVAFFASEDSRNITGQSLNVDGGIELN
jgi:meso-butanediol dehydrogenase/(S,S)-butanediol dehydrogenase/diacetyl reductase